MDSLSGGLVQLRVGCLCAKAVRLSVTFNNFSSCFCVVLLCFFFLFFFPDLKDVLLPLLIRRTFL